MTNSKSTKRALLTSTLAILACVAMLIGTTFAWFTDTASTGVNKIQAGNLKMEVSYKNTSDGEFAVLDENTNVFMEDTLWEPGHVEYAVLNVKNIGTLALKYKLGINIVSETGSTNVNNEAFKLSDYIKYAVIGDEMDVSNRAALVAAAEAADSKLINAGYTSEETPLKAAQDTDETLKNEKTVTLVVWMPTTVGNDANHAADAAAPTIDLGINVVATQYTHESDSFGEDYDAGATYPATVSEIKEKYGVDGLKMPSSVEIAEDMNYPTTQGKGHFIITLKDEEAFVYFTQVFDREAACVARKKALDEGTVTKFEGEHVINALNMWYYNDTATIKLASDVDLAGANVKPFTFGGHTFVFDGQDHTVKNAKLTGTTGFFGIGAAVSNLTLDNIHVMATGEKFAGVVVGYSARSISNVTVKNSSVTGGKYTGAIIGDCYANVTDCTVENTVVSGQYKVGGIAGYVCNEDDGVDQLVTGNTLKNVTVKGENLLSENTLVIGKIVGNWNKQNTGNAVCKDNTFSGTTTATANIGLILGTVTES